MQLPYTDLCSLCCTKRALGIPEPVQCMHCAAHIERERTREAIAEYTGLRGQGARHRSERLYISVLKIALISIVLGFAVYIVYCLITQ